MQRHARTARVISKWMLAFFAPYFLPIASVTSGQEADSPPGQLPARTAEDGIQNTEQDHSSVESDRLDQARVIEAHRMILAVKEVFFGATSNEVATLHDELADMLESTEDFDAAIASRKSAIRILTALHGVANYRVTDAQWKLRKSEQLAAADSRTRADYLIVKSLKREIERHYVRREFAPGIQFAEQAIAITERILGDGQPDTADLLNILAMHHLSLHDYFRAEPLFLRARQIRKEALGEQHPDYATSLYNLAGLYEMLGDYARAEPFFRQALEIRQMIFGDESRDIAESLDGLAGNYSLMADYVRAEPLYRKSLEIRFKVLGDRHPEYAKSLNNLGQLYWDMADYARAEQCHRQAREIQSQSLGEENIYFANTLNSLACLRALKGDKGGAEQFYRRVIEIQEKILGDEHPSVAVSLNNFAELYDSMCDYERAEPLLVRALQIQKKVTGEEHPTYALLVCNLAGLYRDRGDHARAESLYRRAIDIQRVTLGEENSALASSELQLAGILLAQGLREESWELFIRAWTILSRNRDRTASIQSERQQFAARKGMGASIDELVSLALETGYPASIWYPFLCGEKGRITLGQREQRALARIQAAAGDTEAADIAVELQSATRRLGAVSQRTPSTDEREGHLVALEKLTEQIEDLQKQLSARSVEYLATRAETKLSPTELAGLMPREMALIDILACRRFAVTTPAVAGSGREPLSISRSYLAFVSRPDRPEVIAVVQLGDAAPIENAISTWLENPGVGPGRGAGEELRRLVWAPIESELSDDTTTVLVSPDGALARLPWGALPGKVPGSYLIEERAFATLPAPQLLAEYVSNSNVATTVDGNANLDTSPSLLLIGDVSYGGDPGSFAPALAEELAISSTRAAAVRGKDRLWNWSDLNGTRQEIVSIRDSFEQYVDAGRVLTPLRKETATEEAVREQAPQATHLHFATHGYFAPESLRSVLQSSRRDEFEGLDRAGGGLFGQMSVSGYNPGLLSGIVLAGANQPIDPDKDDGILTATEVAELDLHRTRLAVLSACETGLGVSAGGEGLLGLQRAFQVAGCRSVIATMWKIPDEHSRSLMVEFYENLWAKKQPTLMALRNAQLSMLREGRKRGLAIDDAHPSDENNRLPPYYWAGFVLSGAWE